MIAKRRYTAWLYLLYLRWANVENLNILWKLRFMAGESRDSLHHRNRIRRSWDRSSRHPKYTPLRLRIVHLQPSLPVHSWSCSHGSVKAFQGVCFNTYTCAILLHRWDENELKVTALCVEIRAYLVVGRAREAWEIIWLHNFNNARFRFCLITGLVSNILLAERRTTREYIYTCTK